MEFLDLNHLHFIHKPILLSMILLLLLNDPLLRHLDVLKISRSEIQISSDLFIDLLGNEESMTCMKVVRRFICRDDVHLAVQYQNFSYPEEGCWPGRHDVFVTKNGQVNQVRERNLQLFLHKSSKAHKWINTFWMHTCWTTVQNWLIKVERWGVSWLSRNVFEKLWPKKKKKENKR